MAALKPWQSVAFGVIAFISITNLNGVAKLLWDVDAAFSWALVVAALAFVAPPAASLWLGLGEAGWLFVFFLSLFLGIGAAVAQIRGSQPHTMELVRQALSSLLIVIPSAQYAFVATRSGRLPALFNTLAALCAVHVIAVLSFGWWGAETYGRVVSGVVDFDQNRYSGLFWNPNEAGQALVVATLVFIAVAGLSRRTWLPMLLAGSSSLAVLFTFSRGSILLLLIVLLYTTFRSRLRHLTGLLAGVAVLGILLVVLFDVVGQPTFIGDAEWTRVTDVGEFLRRGRTMDRAEGDRAELLGRGIQEWMNSPFVGNGLGSQRFLGGESIGVHNTIVMVLGEAGVIPSIAFVAFMYVYLRRSLALKPVIRDFLFAFGIVIIGICLQSHNFLETRFDNAILGVAFGILSGSTLKSRKKPRMAIRQLWCESAV